MDWLNDLLARLKAGLHAAAEWTAEKIAKALFWLIDHIPIDTHPALKAVIALLILAFVGVAGSFLLAGMAVAGDTQQYRVIDFKCDKEGGVTALQIVVAEPMVLSLGWANREVCGRPT